MTESMNDQHLRCADCGGTFLFSTADQLVFQQKGYQTPKRCVGCRAFKRQQRGNMATPQ
jgi:Probable zinc-ribbon domain